MDFGKVIEKNNGHGELAESSGPLYSHPFSLLQTAEKTINGSQHSQSVGNEHSHQSYLPQSSVFRRPLLVHTGGAVDYQSDVNLQDHSVATAARVSLRNQELLALKNAYSSLNSDISCSSVSSVESLLELRRENPEEILLALGFGGASYEENIDPLLRIPCRFFEHQSKARGVHVGEVISKRKSHLMLQRSFEHEGHYHRHHHEHNRSHSDYNHRSLSSKQNEPLQISVKQPKLLVMGSKLYEFDGDSDMCSPKTSIIQESGTSPAPSFLSVHSPPLFSRESVISPNLSHHSSENFLTVPNGGLGYRKLSCPNIDFELAHSSRDQLKMDEYIAHVKSQSGSIEQLGLQQSTSISATSNLSPAFEHHSESLDQLSLKLGSFLTDLGGSNSNLNLSYFIEAALITSIQSLKLSLDFYRYFMLVKSNSTDSGTGTCFTMGSLVADQFGQNNATPSTLPSNDSPESSFESDKQRLILQNLYLDVLEVETMLYDCLAKFKNSPNWPIFVSKYIHQLQKAVHKISQIQESLRRLNARYCRPLPPTI